MNAATSSSEMPWAEAPAPAKTTRWSRILWPVMRSAPYIPARTTAAVPWMSSLNVQSWSRKRASWKSAFSLRKSSHCSTTRGKTFFTAATNASMNSWYASPRTRSWRMPR